MGYLYVFITFNANDIEKEEADTICAKISLTFFLFSEATKVNLSKNERRILKKLQSDASNCNFTSW